MFLYALILEFNMLFDKNVKPGGYEVVKEGANNVLRVNYNEYSQVPSIEDSAVTMAKVVDMLVEVPGVNMIVFSQRRNYTYGYEQTDILNEIASLYSYLTKQKRILTLSLFDQTEAFRIHSQEWGEGGGRFVFWFFFLLFVFVLWWVVVRTKKKKKKKKHVREEEYLCFFFDEFLF